MTEIRTHFDSLFAGSYDLRVGRYAGPDSSRIAILFSGQGLTPRDAFQAAYERGGEIRAAFDRADELAQEQGFPQPSSYFRGSDPKSDVLARMLALFTLQVGIFRELTKEGVRPHVITGFSAGEFAAVVASGIASFEDVLQIVAYRERVSPPANELGYMIAVASDPATIADRIGADHLVANRNAPAQTVIAIRAADRAEIEKRLKKKRLPHRVLEDVPQPFHTPWMQPVADAVRAFIHERNFAFSAPAVPIFSSVAKRFLTGSDASLDGMAAILGNQVVEAVDFLQQVEAVYDAGAISFLEIGPARVLSEMIPAILGERLHKVVRIETFLVQERHEVAARNVEAARASPVFDVVRRVIARLTGYEIESISVEDRFQEDLGIDSIKKADIIFTVLNESERELGDAYNAASIRDIADAVTLIDGANPLSGGASGPAREGRFERSGETWVPEPLPAASATTALRDAVVVRLADVIDGKVSPLDLFGGNAKLIVLADRGDSFSGSGSATERPESNIERLMMLFRGFRAVMQRGIKRDVTLMLAAPADAHPFVRGLGAFFKSLRIEAPSLFFKQLFTRGGEDERELLAIASAEMADVKDVDVSYASGAREVMRLRPLIDAEAAPISPGTIIVAFGGARGIGFALLDRLVEETAGLRIVIAGRSASDDAAVATALEQLGRNEAEVAYVQADARRTDDVAKSLQWASSRWGRVDLVLNGVGVDRIGALAAQTDEELRPTLDSKIHAAVNILNHAKVHGAKSLHFSSITARYGNPGQTAYACANEIMNRIVEAEAAAVHERKPVSINWPPWDGVGMTASPRVYLDLKRSGFALLGAPAATRLLLQDIAGSGAAIVDYADESDRAIYEAPLHDQRAMRPLLGNPTLDHRFERELKPAEEEWLRDHRIEGVAYLPAATAAAIAFAVGEGSASTPLRTIEDLEIMTPLRIESGSATLSIEMRLHAGVVVVIGRTNVPHFRCRLIAAAPLGSIEPFPSRGEKVKTARVYRPGVFFHGPRFQTMHSGVVASNGDLTIRIERSKLLPIYGIPVYDRLTQWVDAAFQALAFEAYRKHEVMALPAGVARLTRSDDLAVDSDVQLRCAFGGLSERIVGGDATVATLDGRVLVHLEGITLGVAEQGGPPR